MRKPQNAIALSRRSELRAEDLYPDGQVKGNVDAREQIDSHSQRIGWKIGRVIVENDVVATTGTKGRRVSAFKRRRVTLPNGRSELRTFRPGFRLALDLLASGEYDGLIVLDLDRTARDPRDLEDLIDVVEEHRVPVDSVSGSLKLANDADITMARVMVAVANKESRHKARRVTAARRRQAMDGEYGGGRRPYGFCMGPPALVDDADPAEAVCQWHRGRDCQSGITKIDAECDVIGDSSTKLVQGASLKSLAADLRDRAVPTVTGTAWTAETLRDILLRPRNAGRMVYQDAEIGDAPWTPVVPVERFREVQRILTDPSRRTSGAGAPPKWLGTNLFRCGACRQAGMADPTGVHVRSAGRQPAYRCPQSSHLTRNRAHVDALVVGTVLARLAEPDAVDLFAPAAPDVDVPALRAEAADIRATLNDLGRMLIRKQIDRGQMLAATVEGNTRLAEIEAQLHAAIVDSPVKPLIGAEDIQAVWDGLPLSHQRLIIDLLVSVTILPAGRRGRGFDPATVDIRWNPLTPAVG